MVKYFIHTNAKQELASKITQFNSMHNYGAPKASIIKIEDYLDVDKLHNKTYLRNGIETIWDKNDLQSFTILRFLIPELSSYEGISVLTDPDVFLLKPFDEVVKI